MLAGRINDMEAACQTDPCCDVIARIIADGLKSEQLLESRLEHLRRRRNTLRYHLAGFYNLFELCAGYCFPWQFHSNWNLVSALSEYKWMPEVSLILLPPSAERTA